MHGLADKRLALATPELTSACVYLILTWSMVGSI